jgi:1-acyl-sn-glycerol-3-phosphate acyltransferase
MKTDMLPSASQTQPYPFGWFDWLCLRYPPGWLILFNRHWQHYYPDPDGWRWFEYGLFLLPFGFYLAVLVRWLRLGCRLPKCHVKPEFDPAYQAAFRDEVLQPLVNHQFQAELHQVHALPEQGPFIVAMNHAGMCFPWDFMSLAYALSREKDWQIHPLAEASLFEHPWVIWWLPPGWSKVLGGVRAKADKFETAIAQRNILLYAPEGLRGPQKGWIQRYQLQTFHPSFVELSQRHNIPVLPVVCLGNERLHPWTININSIAERLGLPFLPISPLMVLFLLFPSMGVWASRSRLQYVVQPLQTYEYTDEHTKEDRTDSAQSSSMRQWAYEQAQQLRSHLQAQLHQHLSKD